MLPLGQMNHIVTVQNPVTAKDALGAPVQTWVDYQTVYAAIENDAYSAEENNSAPHEGNTQTRVYVVRNHRDFNFNTQQRVLDRGATFAITAIRYDSRATVCYLDCLSGAASG